MTARLRTAAEALLAEIRRRHPHEEPVYPTMIEVSAALAEVRTGITPTPPDGPLIKDMSPEELREALHNAEDAVFRYRAALAKIQGANPLSAARTLRQIAGEALK